MVFLNFVVVNGEVGGFKGDRKLLLIGEWDLYFFGLIFVVFDLV